MYFWELFDIHGETKRYLKFLCIIPIIIYIFLNYVPNF